MSIIVRLNSNKNHFFIHYDIYCQTVNNRSQIISVYEPFLSRVSNMIDVKIKLALQKTKYSINDFFGKCDKIRSFLRIWSHLMKKSLMDKFIFYAVILSGKSVILSYNKGKNSYHYQQPYLST